MTNILRIDEAFKAGDLGALRAAVDDPAVIPNGLMPLAIGSCLEYAIYHSPLAFVRELLDLGADPRADDPGGFPPLIAAISCSRNEPGSPARGDVVEIMELLLAHGADPDQRGINDYTALHMAVAENNVQAVRLLVAHGADPSLRTRIDECETPLDMAQRAGLVVIADLLRAPAR